MAIPKFEAAFRHLGGQYIIVTGPYHDIEQLADAVGTSVDDVPIEEWEAGFMHGGRFLTRQEAAAVVGKPGRYAHAENIIPYGDEPLLPLDGVRRRRRRR